MLLQALTAAAMAALSDLLAQRLASSRATNWRRAAAIALYGLLVAAPTSHFWQHTLVRLFPKRKDSVRR